MWFTQMKKGGIFILFSFIFYSCILTGCNEKHQSKELNQTQLPKIDIKNYKNLVKDILCIEAAIYKLQIEGKDYVGYAISYYNWLVSKYDISIDEIKNVTEFYVRNGIMQSIMNEIIEELKYIQISLDTINLSNTVQKPQKQLQTIFPFRIDE